MNDFALKFKVPSTVSDDEARRNFYWPPAGGGSYVTTLTPRLGTLGPVSLLNADFVRLAVLVYSADRSVLRAVGTVNWTSRTYSLTVPVSDPAAWTTVSDRLTNLLWFLSGDTWTLVFTKARPPAEKVAPNQHPDAERVVLLSGGADSGCGALRARLDAPEHLLFSHFGGNGVGPKQRDVAERIREAAPDGATQHHVQVGFRRSSAQPNGMKFKNEHSTRTRSLLFLALGLAAPSVNEIPLWIPENGFASLNPAMGADQLGSVSTKTTHPWFLAELESILTAVGAQGVIENPFMHQTKGEMFSWVAGQLGNDKASTFLSETDSCGFTNKRFWRIPRAQHCGTCFGCLMRRASFAAANLNDHTTYAVDSPPSPRAGEVLSAGSLMPSIRGHVARGVRVSDIAAMRLPSGYTPGMARDLCVRGATELGLLP
jgi:7-cyano-7-deazaguanine synthase in queuosine biosynthesis